MGITNEAAPQPVGAATRTAIPFIVAPTGTMANNGAVTLGTALNAIYPSAYLFLPAGAIAAGSGAGWYYTVFSSTTVGTVFNNVYAPATVAGGPVIPPTAAFVTTGPGAFTGVTAATVAVALQIPAGTLGPNGQLRAEVTANVNNSAGVKTIAIGIGPTTASLTAVASVAPTTTVGQKTLFSVYNRGSQVVNNIGIAAAYGPGAAAALAAVGTINFGVANLLVATLTLAVATDTLVLEALSYEAFTQ